MGFLRMEDEFSSLGEPYHGISLLGFEAKFAPICPQVFDGCDSSCKAALSSCQKNILSLPNAFSLLEA
jgi:hypothetical protein